MIVVMEVEIMSDKNDGRIGRMPAAINEINPEPRSDAKEITKVVKHSGEITGYELSNGERISKEEGIRRAKSGDIRGVGVATRKGEEYLRSLPDDVEGNNLSSLPVISE